MHHYTIKPEKLEKLMEAKVPWHCYLCGVSGPGPITMREHIDEFHKPKEMKFSISFTEEK